MSKSGRKNILFDNVQVLVRESINDRRDRTVFSTGLPAVHVPVRTNVFEVSALVYNSIFDSLRRSDTRSFTGVSS